MMKSKTKFKETEIGMIPEDWKVLSLEDCTTKITDGTHSTVYDVEGGDYFLLSCKNIKDGQILFGNNERKIDKNTLDSLRKRTGLQKGDILLTTVGTIGESSIIRVDNVNFEIQRSVAIIRSDSQKIDKNYLYHVTKSGIFRSQTYSYARGSVQKCLFLGEINKILIPVPSIMEQKNISKFFSNLESKIELNQQINQTLETIGKAIFKHWFIDFEFPNGEDKPYKSSGGEMIYNKELEKEIPKGWESSNIDEEFNLVMGQSPPGSSYNGLGEGTVFFQGRTDFGYRFPSIRMFCTEPSRFARKGDTLISVRAPVGDINLALQDCCIGRGLAAIRHKSNHSSYTYYFMMTLKPIFDHFESEGTVFGSIGKTDFEKIKVIAPDENIVNSFQNVLESIDTKIENNALQTLALSSIRDSLLPKLMSGKIRVPMEAR